MNSERMTSTLAKVMIQMSDGFKSESAKKQCLSDINCIYDSLSWIIRKSIINKYSPNTNLCENEEMHSLYWDIPNSISRWNESISNRILLAIPEVKEVLDRIGELTWVRSEVKEMIVNKPIKKAESELEIKVRTAVKQEMNKAKADYAYGLKLHEIFGSLPVSVNAHYVVNQFGTSFIRCFYYLNDKIVKLSVIIALMQEIDSKNKKGESKWNLQNKT